MKLTQDYGYEYEDEYEYEYEYEEPVNWLETSDRGHIFKTFTNNPKFYIGVEIEKEDEEVLTGVDIDDFLVATDHYFKKVEDTSLDLSSGYELITPALELIPEEIDTFLKNYPLVIKHINAGTSYRCGGHINLSENGLTGEEFFDKIKGYTPLLYSLNPTRLRSPWSKAKSTKVLKQEKEKGQAIVIWPDRVELRIFSAVENYDQLIWRIQLCSLICSHPTDNFETAFLNCHTVLKNHLKEGYEKDYFDPYGDYKDYSEFIEAIVNHTLNYEDIALNL